MEKSLQIHQRMRESDARLSVMAKLEPLIKTLTNDEVLVVEEVLAGLLSQLTE